MNDVLLEGRLCAAEAALRALILMQHDVKAAAMNVGRELDAAIATHASGAPSDAFIHGVSRARRHILPIGLDSQRRGSKDSVPSDPSRS